MNDKMNNNRRQFLKTSSLAAIIGSTGIRSSWANTNNNIKNLVILYEYGGVRGGKDNWLPDASMNLKSASAGFESIKDDCIFFSDCHLTDKEGAELAFHENNEYFAISDSVKINTLNYHAGVLNKNYYVTPLTNINNGTSSELSHANYIDELSVLDFHQQLRNNQPYMLDILQKHLDETETLINKLSPNIDVNIQNTQTDLQNKLAKMQIDCQLTPEQMGNLTHLKTMQLAFSDMTQALACGKSNVLTYVMSSYEDSEFGDDGTIVDGITSVKDAVQTGSDEQALAVKAMYDSQTVAFIEQLKSTNDADGNPLLDSTIVLKVSAHGDVKNESMSDAPFMLISGQHINTGQVVSAQGSHLRVLDTVQQLLQLSHKNYSEQGPLTL
ncbi:MAG: hypothetical protein HRU38_18610 [Saccharospirillaceae bacterium]|nr:hypothetical protein [Pseudomonadales bacterium]NRB80649.1 hypothetical protein [Saccharospirillaceae bacterium]